MADGSKGNKHQRVVNFILSRVFISSTNFPLPVPEVPNQFQYKHQLLLHENLYSLELHHSPAADEANGSNKQISTSFHATTGTFQCLLQKWLFSLFPEFSSNLVGSSHLRATGVQLCKPAQFPATEIQRSSFRNFTDNN